MGNGSPKDVGGPLALARSRMIMVAETLALKHRFGRVFGFYVSAESGSEPADFSWSLGRDKYPSPLRAAFFPAAFFTAKLSFAVFRGATAFAAGDFAASARFSAQRFFVPAIIAFRPAALSLRFGFAWSGGAFDVASACFAGGFFSVARGAFKSTAFFACVTASLAF